MESNGSVGLNDAESILDQLLKFTAQLSECGNDPQVDAQALADACAKRLEDLKLAMPQDAEKLACGKNPGAWKNAGPLYPDTGLPGDSGEEEQQGCRRASGSIQGKAGYYRLQHPARPERIRKPPDTGQNIYRSARETPRCRPRRRILLPETLTLFIPDFSEFLVRPPLDESAHLRAGGGFNYPELSPLDHHTLQTRSQMRAWDALALRLHDPFLINRAHPLAVSETFRKTSFPGLGTRWCRFHTGAPARRPYSRISSTARFLSFVAAAFTMVRMA